MRIKSMLSQLQKEMKSLKENFDEGTSYRIDTDGLIVEMSDGKESKLTEAEFISKKEQEVIDGISVISFEYHMDDDCSVLKRYEYYKPWKQGDIKLEDLILEESIF